MKNKDVQYIFGWDPEKAKSNLQKHGVSFEHAVSVFRDPRSLSIYDVDHSNGVEDRWITLGFAATGGLLVVHHTFLTIDKHTIRIRVFSSRKATKREKIQYSE